MRDTGSEYNDAEDTDKEFTEDWAFVARTTSCTGRWPTSWTTQTRRGNGLGI